MRRQLNTLYVTTEGPGCTRTVPISSWKWSSRNVPGCRYTCWRIGLFRTCAVASADGLLRRAGHMHQFFTLMVDFWLASKGPSPAMCYCVVNNIGSVTIRSAVRPLCEISSWESCITSAWYWGVPCVTMATSCRTIRVRSGACPPAPGTNRSQAASGKCQPGSVAGYEGEAAQAYFGVFDGMIRVDSPAMRFHGRSRRPPRDAVNACCRFFTPWSRMTAVPHWKVGPGPRSGVLHRDRPGRPSLALDLLEEFRPLLADRLALSLINRKQVGEQDFQYMDNGAVLLTESSRKTVLVAYQERKRRAAPCVHR